MSGAHTLTHSVLGDGKKDALSIASISPPYPCASQRRPRVSFPTCIKHEVHSGSPRLFVCECACSHTRTLAHSSLALEPDIAFNPHNSLPPLSHPHHAKAMAKQNWIILLWACALLASAPPPSPSFDISARNWECVRGQEAYIEMMRLCVGPPRSTLMGAVCACV